MSVQDYNNAYKAGKKEYHACVYKGKYPYLPVLEDIISGVDIESEISLGTDQIPLRLVVGTCHFGRTNAFADNFMPILEFGSEFSAKWASLCDSQKNEGIRDPIKVYEYMNKFYVIEGNKRVSVLKYLNAVTVNAEVIRKVPRYSEDPDVKIYYEFMEFYKATKLNDIYMSKVGNFGALMKLVGISTDRPVSEDDRMDLTSSFLNFRNAFEARGGDKFDYPVGDAFLRFIHIQRYSVVRKMTPKQMSRSVAKSWGEFEVLAGGGDSSVELKMDPSSAPKKNILSYLLPTPSNAMERLKVGFVYERSPQTSQWCYTHELGRHYIEDVFPDKIETRYIANVKPQQEDEKAIEDLIAWGANIIFLISASMVIASVKEAIAHPEVKIMTCSLDTSHKYIRTYSARMYEAKFLSGMIAGAMCKGGTVGYVAGSPILGTIADINAFALGAKMVNPRAQVYLEWTGVKDREEIDRSFAEKNISVISDQDMITPTSTTRRFGLYKMQPDGMQQHIAMTVWHWGAFYEKLIQSIISGSWKKEEDAENGKALNYWWGMSAGAIELICSDNVPTATRRLIELLKKMILSGELNIFEGKMRDQNGNLVNDQEKEMSPEEIIHMDWLLDNVNGSLPAYEELKEDARKLMELQGVSSKNENQ